VSRRTAVANELWSGFGTPASPSRGPSLLDNPAAGGSHPSQLALGVGLLGLGLLAMFSGVTMTQIRRRRVTAGGTSVADR